MANNLAGLHVLVTRPSPAGEGLCARIAERGGKAFHFPVIAFAPPADREAFKKTIDQIGDQDWLIFNSPQAVASVVPALRDAWPNLPASVKFAAVGAGTAAALDAAGFHHVIYPENEWSSEGLLAMPPFQVVGGQRIMIVRGAGGRLLFEKIFNERHAVVTSCLAYQRVLPDVNVAECEAAISQRAFQVVIAGSFESVTNLKLLLGASVWPSLYELPLIVMSERVKSLAAELGFQTIWVAPNASQQALLDTLSEKKEDLCQMKIKK